MKQLIEKHKKHWIKETSRQLDDGNYLKADHYKYDSKGLTVPFWIYIDMKEKNIHKIEDNIIKIKNNYDYLIQLSSTHDFLIDYINEIEKYQKEERFDEINNSAYTYAKQHVIDLGKLFKECFYHERWQNIIKLDGKFCISTSKLVHDSKYNNYKKLHKQLIKESRSKKKKVLFI